jgi:hypothetical protein
MSALDYKVDAKTSEALEVNLSEVEAHAGVRAIEATNKVFGKYSKWAMFIRYNISPLPSLPS